MLTIASSALALLIAMAASSYAGGFQISVETPGASTDAQMKDVVLVVRTFGCLQPADAKLSATAEGLVNGARKSIALDLSTISAGVFAIKQQWPSEGAWVLALKGGYNEMTTSVLVELGPNGKVLPGTKLDPGAIKGIHARGLRKQLAAADIDSALRTSAGLTSETTNDVDPNSLAPLGPLSWVLAGLGASAISIGFIARGRRRQKAEEVVG